MSAIGPEELEQIAAAMDTVIGQRMEQVYATIEDLRSEVRDAVVSVGDTARVLHDNDTAIMARVMQVEGSGVAPAEFIEQAAASWRAFVLAECARLGIRVMVAKGGE